VGFVHLFLESVNGDVRTTTASPPRLEAARKGKTAAADNPLSAVDRRRAAPAE